ncbi:D(1) dopamine receptor-like [Anneissia japonica]|uniref:D(1) dopamine receptor-like n=1 Tax=Anneissia japonica TaxID=1529436 RepID=UPI0014257D5F|nr:D(1) dopamine receptor-like [Anneissia japonica]XP_033104495.1 D(1) dopamine receptor-like [Anneissia japonica]XP_033104496.1 D(1) dopamine receptor-like [Anneissia japonica]XP_033104497.1 D(1) dopamine receptor-like [Anneissia japonica]XP_033104498.1 D(1) dopamine receptor-like [Anneissia japonica]XP_033104500.1 D(1) dopamine receptor-like [Anneissia japonica]
MSKVTVAYHPYPTTILGIGTSVSPPYGSVILGEYSTINSSFLPTPSGSLAPKNVLNGTGSTTTSTANFNKNGSEICLLDEPDAQVAAGIALACITLATFLGNCLVIASVLNWRHLRSRITNHFIVSLAFSDVLVALLVMSFSAVGITAGYWPFGKFCDVFTALDIMMSTASILNLFVISLDRYWAIMHPFQYQSKMTKKRAKIMIMSAWIVSALLSFVPVLTGIHREGGTGIDCPTPICIFALNKYYSVVSSCISFYIPSAIMVGLYSRIYFEAQRQEKQIRLQTKLSRHQKHARGERRAAKTLGTIMGAFVFCWLPFFVVNCIRPFCNNCIDDIIYTIFVWLGWINSSINPLIYSTNTEFRSGFKRLLCRKAFYRDRDNSEFTALTNVMAYVSPNKSANGNGSSTTDPNRNHHVRNSPELQVCLNDLTNEHIEPLNGKKYVRIDQV